MSFAPALVVDGRASRGRQALGIDPTLRQFLFILPLFLVCGGIPFVGLGSVARPLFMAGAIVICYTYRRRSPWLFITATLWFWTFTPLIRRLIDYRSGFNPTDPILATPELVAAFMLIDVVQDRRLFSRPAAQLGLLVLLPALWGLAVSLVDGQIASGIVGSVDWIIPLLYYFYIISHADRIDSADRCLTVFLALNGLAIVAYGLFQAFWLPEWDMTWLVLSGLDTSKRFDEGGFRVFGSLNSAGIMAYWLSALLTLGLQFRTLLSVVVVPGAAFLLLLTGVRSVTGATLAVILVATLTGKRKALLAVAATVAVLVLIGAVVSTVNPALAERTFQRFGDLDLGHDDSALARAQIIRGSPAIVDRYPLGLGIGALGRGAVVSSDTDLVSVDFGPLAIYLSLGWVAGTVYLGGLFILVGYALALAARCGSERAMVFALVAAGLIVQLVIVNVGGVSGMILWMTCGFAVAYSSLPRAAPV